MQLAGSVWASGVVAYLLVLLASYLFVRLNLPAGEKQHSRRYARTRLMLYFFAIVSASVVFAAMLYVSGSPAPLGAPLPEVASVVAVDGISIKQTSVLKKTINADMLEFLAPQPDGMPPLRYTYSCEYVDFSIQHPMGTELFAFGPQDVLGSGALARATLKFDYPLQLIEYSAPLRKAEEKLHEYVARRRWELTQQGAKFYGNHDPLVLADYKFERFEYELTNDKGEAQSHFVFFGPYGNRTLTCEYVSKPELHELARPLVAKIINSFKPGPKVLEAVQLMDPDYAGKATVRQAHSTP